MNSKQDKRISIPALSLNAKVEQLAKFLRNSIKETYEKKLVVSKETKIEKTGPISKIAKKLKKDPVKQKAKKIA
jgi:hypothetical protein